MVNVLKGQTNIRKTNINGQIWATAAKYLQIKHVIHCPYKISSTTGNKAF